MNIHDFIVQDDQPVGAISSPSDCFEVILDILEVSAKSRLLGELVYFLVTEGDSDVLVLGQITDIRTQNRWHEEPSFKAVIKRHGKLPHLSDIADNRIAKLTVQSTFDLKDQENPTPHKLANSPSTGVKVKRMTNPIMDEILKGIKAKNSLTVIGRAYGTDVDIPFWFRHFGDGQDGASDTYHIGVFGRTGSGKTVTASNMLLGYSRNTTMNILVLDPQSQFYEGKKLIFSNATEDKAAEQMNFEEKVSSNGMKFSKYKVLEDIYLPGNDATLFSELLVANGFVKKAFKPIYNDEKEESTRQAVETYISVRMNNTQFNLNDCDHSDLLKKMIDRFNKKDEGCDDCSKYVVQIWGTKNTRERLKQRLKQLIDNMDPEVKALWSDVCNYFKPKKENGESKMSIQNIVEKSVKEKRNFIVLDVSGQQATRPVINENLQALFINLLERKMVETAGEMYISGEPANTLVVMDEAHRFISKKANDERIQSLSGNIIDSVRTTRKFGIGYMFITQTIESMDDEILQQMRVFAFGYGLTIGKEYRVIKDIINDDNAAKFYKSFIDPSSNGKYPFMFHGPISPLSFTGSPLFLEIKEAKPYE